MMPNRVCCPECHRPIDLDEAARAALEEKRGREYDIECSDGHVFSAHEGALATILEPKHYNVFWPIQGMEQGQVVMRVGEWRGVRLSRPFEKIDDVKTIYYPQEEGSSLTSARAEARFDNTHPHEFWIMTSGDEREWGQRLCVEWTAYGMVPATSLDVWRENLLFAARQFLNVEYRPCIIQSAVAVESFVYDFVIGSLNKAGWDSGTINDYVRGTSRDSLPLQGVIQVYIRKVIGIQIAEEVWAKWQRLKKMRDALVHGDLSKYRELTDHKGQCFMNEHDHAQFAYQTAVRFIYEIRYPESLEQIVEERDRHARDQSEPET